MSSLDDVSNTDPERLDNFRQRLASISKRFRFGKWDFENGLYIVETKFDKATTGEESMSIKKKFFTT